MKESPRRRLKGNTKGGANGTGKERPNSELDRQGITREGIAKQLGVGVASVYRVLREAKANDAVGSQIST